MRRREPPPLATWMLRHLTAGDRDEALDGDLIEVFRLGRSSLWYWRQITAVCVLSWRSNLYARGPALVFALLWSMLSPVWYVTINEIEASCNLDQAWKTLGPLWLPVAIVGWIALHVAFLWAGLLVYQFVHAAIRKPVQHREFRRAFWTLPLILPPVYGATFLFANLYWYSLPGLPHAQLAPTLLGKIVDLGILPNLLRFPYFVALVVALWGTVHRNRSDVNPQYIASISGWTPTSSDTITAAPLPRSAAVHRFLVFMVGAGLVNSMIAALVLCRLPESHSMDLLSLFANALKFVVIGVLGGIVGSWLYWKSPASPLREGSPLPFSLFALTCAAGWVWVPAMMLFAEQVAAITAFVALVGAVMLAMGLRRATYFSFAPTQAQGLAWDEGELFAESLYRPPFELHGYAIALGLFGAGAALANQSNYTAAALLAISASIFAWKDTLPGRQSFDRDVQVKRAIMRAASTAVAAILLTMWALLNGVAHRNEAAQANAAKSAQNPAARSVPVAPKASLSATGGAGGYESVVLWPYPANKAIVPPFTIDASILGPGTKRPLIIRFDGSYWFLQPPSKRPGPEAHVAHGTPVNVDLESNNAVALVMNAHQKLARAIPTARCREIAIAIENRDNKPGLVSLGVLLTDENSSPNRTRYLGQQAILSTEPGNFFVKTTPAYETLRFAVPPDTSLQKFNKITVMFLPDIEHTFVAPKIAIQQFELFPR